MTTTPDIVHHLIRPGDLLPVCGTVPGPDPRDGDWHAGHDRDLLLQCLSFGLCCCSTCLSPESLGGWTPLVPDYMLTEDGVDLLDDDGLEEYLGE